MPRMPLVAVRAALRSAIKASGEADHRPWQAIEGHGQAQAKWPERRPPIPRVRTRAQISVHSRFVT